MLDMVPLSGLTMKSITGIHGEKRKYTRSSDTLKGVITGLPETIRPVLIAEDHSSFSPRAVSLENQRPPKVTDTGQRL